MPSFSDTIQTIVLSLDPTVFTPQTAQIRRGLPFRFSPYIYIGGVAIDNVTAVVNVTAKIAPKNNPLTVLVEKVQTSVYIAGTGSSGSGPGCCDFDYTTSDANLDLTGGNGESNVFRVYFSVEMTGGSVIPIGVVDLTVYEDASALALAVIGSNLQNARITTANLFQIRDPDTNLWHTLIVADGQLSITAGVS